MKGITIAALFCLLAAAPVAGQDYEAFLKSGEELFNNGDYMAAMEKFELAYESADTEELEAQAMDWRKKCVDKVKQSLAEVQKIKNNTGQLVKMALNVPKTKVNESKKLFELCKDKGIAFLGKRSYYDAYQHFIMATLCHDYIKDPEIDNYLTTIKDSVANYKKIALVIGNADYVETNLEKVLVDAKDMEKALQGMGFRVMTGFNLRTKEFNEKINEFIDATAGYDMLLFFYSGFGYQSDYLLPVDTRTQDDGNLKNWISFNYLMSEFNKKTGARQRIYILDMDRTIRSGIVPSVLTYTNSLVLFSATPNNRAYNGVGRNSLFMEQFLKFMNMPNTSLQDIFKMTRDATIRVSKNKQIPTLYDNIQQNVYLNVKLD
jgi:tetratricopeptide (TPR) repeat protein